MGDSLATLLPVRRPGDAAPLFCVHPAGGLAWCYAALLRGIDHRVPVYGLQSHGLPDGAHTSVSALAAHYVREIRVVQPHGPYRLLGWSFGGLVAHAMAVALRRDGEEVELLAVLDSAPAADTAPDNADSGRTDTDRTVAGHLAALAAAFGYDVTAWPGRAPSVEELPVILRSEDGPLAGFDEPAVARIVDAAAANADLAAHHAPDVFDGRMLLFRAEGSRAVPAVWRRFVSGTVTTIDVPATHHAMMRPDAAAVICQVLNSELREGESAVGAQR